MVTNLWTVQTLYVVLLLDTRLQWLANTCPLVFSEGSLVLFIYFISKSIITWSISQPTCHSLEEILEEALSNEGLWEVDTLTPGSIQTPLDTKTSQIELMSTHWRSRHKHCLKVNRNPLSNESWHAVHVHTGYTKIIKYKNWDCTWKSNRA